ncbi:MAG TPA: hypothetical protein VKH15_03590 [Candidatus Acidoferrum sp.]|nr:hypothetical protein [Candidatus Acidoferrum sp.]
MRTFMVVAAILMVMAWVSVNPAGDRKMRGFALQLVPSQNAIQPGVATWKVGAAAFVLVMMINNSNRTVHYSLTNPGFDWEMDVRDGAGNPVPESQALRKMKQDAQKVLISGRNILGTLKPHETAQDTVEVSCFYDLSRPGKYSIQVQRVFSDVGKEFVQSNRLERTIEP